MKKKENTFGDMINNWVYNKVKNNIYCLIVMDLKEDVYFKSKRSYV